MRNTVAEEEDDSPADRRAGKDRTRASDSKGVRVARTRLGKGVFARKSYEYDALIGEIEGEVIHDPNYGSDYCMEIGEGSVLEPCPPFRFVNHSCEPSCRFDWFDVLEPGESRPRRRVFLIAMRYIKPDEELTIDYHWSATAAIPCRCHAPSCRGWIVDPKQLSDLVR